MPKDNVVSFRLDEKKFTALTEKLQTDKPVGVKSTNQLSRKIVEDLLDGRLVYKDEADRLTDYSYLASTEA